MTDTALMFNSAASNLPSQFTGKERDAETGLDYFGARYYSGAQGRFLSVDPENAGAKKEDPQSWNAYAYSRNNPLKYIDPSGEAWEIASGGSTYWYTDEEFAQKRGSLEADGFLFSDDGSIYGRNSNNGLSYVGSYSYLGPDSILKSIFGKYLSFMNRMAEGGEWLDEHPEAALALTAGMAVMTPQGAAAAEKQGAKLLSAGITNRKLLSIISKLWRPGATYGDGSTMDAARYEWETGILIKGKDHVAKLISPDGSYLRKGLTKLLHNPNLDPTERKVVKQLLIEIQNSVSGPHK